MNFIKIFKNSFNCFFSTKKSIEQTSYYQNRLSNSKNHSYPHFYPTLTISKFLSQY